jgi:hypothetical protein
MSKNSIIAATIFSLFSTRTVDGIIGNINRQIVALDKAAAKQLKNRARLHALADKLDVQASNAGNEAQRAIAVKTKLQKLVA